MDPEGRHPDALSIRGYVYGRAGRPGDARRTLATLDSLSSPAPVTAFHIAVVHIGLGDHDRALDLLEQAAAERTWRMRLLGVEPIFDPLRSEPRFQALLKQVGLRG